MSIDVHIDIVMSCHTMLLSYQIITVSQDYFHIPRMRHEKGNGPFFIHLRPQNTGCVEEVELFVHCHGVC